MKFEPRCFLAIAQRNQVSFTLSGNGKIKINAPDIPTFGLFVLAAKKHKRKLLKHLQEQAASRQTDLFDDAS